LRGSERPPADDAYHKALDYLARRDRSGAELRRLLSRCGFPEQSVSAALERLVSQGLLDDGRFASRWVDSALRSGRGVGAKLLADLQQRGIPREAARQAVDAAEAEHPADRVLAEIMQRRFASFDHESASPREKQRVYGYLQRRGFSFSDVIRYFRDQEMG
jgi:regulatory protein